MTTGRWKLINAATLVAVIALNGLAATGAMSGHSIGELANASASLFLPANYVFGIWSLIYLGLMGSLGRQLWPGDGSARAVSRLGPWWLVEGVLNVAWITLFSFVLYGAALLVMLVFLGTLIVATERVRRDPPHAVVDQLLMIWPQDLYLAWISVAVIANSFQYAHIVGFGGFGVPETTWSVGMMAVATILGIVMAFRKGNWIFPFVVAWALHGIGDRYAEMPQLAVSSQWLVTFGLVAGPVSWAVGTWQRRRSARAAS